ncbi:MAG: hypothetical protein JXR20_05260 [Balneola sp.]
MDKEEKEQNFLLNQNSASKLDLKLGKEFKSFSSDKDLNFINGFQLVSAFIQVFMGTAVVALSIIELIQPTWLATIMSIIGSISIISGLICSYNMFSNADNFNSLVNKAIKRVITFQN